MLGARMHMTGGEGASRRNRPRSTMAVGKSPEAGVRCPIAFVRVCNRARVALPFASVESAVSPMFFPLALLLCH